MMIGVIPFPEPTNANEADCIEKLASYVLRNGIEFEDKIRSTERANPKFQFLVDQNSDEHYYYQWVTYCLKQHIDDGGKLSAIDQFKTKIRHVQPGTVDLTEHDKTELRQLLSEGNNANDRVCYICDWAIDRSHSTAAIAHVLSTLVASQTFKFSAALLAVCVVNEILINRSQAQLAGKYFRILSPEVNESFGLSSMQCWLPYLPCIINNTCTKSSCDIQRIRNIIDLWIAKKLVPNAVGNDLTMLVSDSKGPFKVMCVPTPWVLASPYWEQQSANTILSHHQPPPIISQQYAHLQHYQQQQLPQQQLHAQFVPPPPPPPPSLRSAPVATLSGPPPLPPPSLSSAISAVNMRLLPVGQMINMIKTAHRAGVAPYQPVDMTSMASHLLVCTPHVEHGRLEARVSDYYKKVSALAQVTSSGRDGERDNDMSHKRNRFDSDAPPAHSHGLARAAGGGSSSSSNWR